jgi:hypothetical protein
MGKKGDAVFMPVSVLLWATFEPLFPLFYGISCLTSPTIQCAMRTQGELWA